MNRNTDHMDFIETIDLACVAEIQTMGTCMIPPNVEIDRIIIEPRDNPHLGDFRLVMTVDGTLVYSDETPRGRFSIDVDDRRTASNTRQIIAVVIPQEIPSAIRSYLRNESLQITVIGRHRDDHSPEGNPSDSGIVELATIQVDHLNPDFTPDFIDEWA